MVNNFARESIDERNVVGMNILHEYPVGLQDPQDRLSLWPVSVELLPLRVQPIRHDFLRKVERPIQIRPGEIKYERAADHGHFDGPEFIVVADQLGNFVSVKFPLRQCLATEDKRLAPDQNQVPAREP